MKKEAEKILKYKKSLQQAYSSCVRTSVIPVIIEASGTILMSLRKYLSNMPGKHEIKEQQKRAILGKAHILWKVLM
jgi:hypothetical protein